MVNGSVIKKILFVYFHKYCRRLVHDIELIMGAGPSKIKLSWGQVDIFSNVMGQKGKLIWANLKPGSFMFYTVKGRKHFFFKSHIGKTLIVFLFNRGTSGLVDRIKLRNAWTIIVPEVLTELKGQLWHFEPTNHGQKSLANCTNENQ